MHSIMKRILTAVLVALCAVACAKHEIEVEDVEYTYATALEEGGADSLEIEISLEWPVRGLPPVALENIQYGVAGFIFGKELATTNIQKTIEGYVERESNIYRQCCVDFRKMLDENDENGSQGMFSWSRVLEGHFLEPYNDMQSYLIYTYGYAGGAHGMDYEKGMTFSLSNGELITEADLFEREYKPELSKILTAHLPESVSKEVYDMLFIKSIEPNGNFYIDEDGITYVYERYEIGPYASGLVKVSVPWSELQSILK